MKTKDKHPEYSVYQNMKTRCYNKNRESWQWYGAKGIIVCDRWLESFWNFLEDMGPRPTSKHSIDRVNPNKNYEPSNCIWATAKEQAYSKCVKVNTHCINCKKQILKGGSRKGLCHTCNEYQRRNNISRPTDENELKKLHSEKIKACRSKKVIQYDKQKNKIKTFNSVTDAITVFGTGVMNCLSGRSATSYGFLWEYE
jgi:hypothetical protein